MIVAWMPPYSRSVVHAMEQGGLPTSLRRLQHYAKVLQEHRSLRPAAAQGHTAQDRMEADRQRYAIDTELVSLVAAELPCLSFHSCL